MRVISGISGGLPLKTLAGLDTRPTSDKVKGAIFSILGEKVAGSCVFDLFSGSGGMAIEALSRGAKSAFLVDSSKKAVEIIKKNLEFTHLSGEVFLKDARSFLLSCEKKADIIFLDPPYFSSLTDECMKIIGEKGLLSEGGIIVAESDEKENLPEKMHGFKLADRRVYGRICVSFFSAE